MSGELQTLLWTVAVGLAALVPARRTLGTSLWLLLGLPTGLVAWSLPPLVDSVIPGPLSWGVVAPVTLAFIGATVAVSVWLEDGRRRDAGSELLPESERPGALASAVVFLLGAGLVARLFERIGLVVTTLDGWAGYELFGSFLNGSGYVTVEMISWRSLLLPAYIAVQRELGGELAYVVYPMAATTVALLVGYALWTSGGEKGPGPLARRTIAGAVVVLMVTVPLFRIHTIYMHANMLSGLLLTAGLVVLLPAASSRLPAGERRVRLLVAALMGIGLGYARTDGIAYAFVLFAVIAFAVLLGRMRWSESLAFFVPYVVASSALHVVLIAREGWYSYPDRVGASGAAAILGLSALVPLVLWGLERAAEAYPAVRSPRVVAYGLAALGVAAILVSVAVAPDRFAELWSILSRNLFERGGWGRYWYWAIGVLLLGGVGLASRTSRDRPLPALWTAVWVFLVVSVLIHGWTHPGRIGWSDSQNRVLIQVMPAFFWLFGEVALLSVAGLRAARYEADPRRDVDSRREADVRIG